MGKKVDKNSISSEYNEAKLEENLKKKTMKVSIAEGSFGVFSSVIADNYIVPFSLSINASPFQIGLFTSLGNLISPVGQIIGSRRSEVKSRKRIICPITSPCSSRKKVAMTSRGMTFSLVTGHSISASIKFF